MLLNILAMASLSSESLANLVLDNPERLFKTSIYLDKLSIDASRF
jgi:hypothetical protein